MCFDVYRILEPTRQKGSFPLHLRFQAVVRLIPTIRQNSASVNVNLFKVASVISISSDLLEEVLAGKARCAKFFRSLPGGREQPLCAL